MSVYACEVGVHGHVCMRGGFVYVCMLVCVCEILNRLCSPRVSASKSVTTAVWPFKIAALII
jgi:hypothetical protein